MTLDRHATWAQDELVSSFDPQFSFLLPLFFSDVKTFTGANIEFDIVEGGERIAPFVSPYAMGKATRSQGYRTFQLKPAYIKLLDNVRPDEGFVRRAGEAYGGSLSVDDRLALAVAEKIATHRKMIENRLEHMASELLFTGQLVIVDDDYPRAVVDFERDANLAMNAGTVWSNIAADPFLDIQTMADRINLSSRGAVASIIVMRSTVFNKFIAVTKVRDSFDRNKNLSSNQNSGMELSGLASASKGPQLRGRLAGLYDVWTYDGYYETDLGVGAYYVPDNKVLVTATPDQVQGKRYHGAIVDLDAQMQAVEIFTKSRRIWNPSAEEVLTQSAPMLGMRRPDTTGVITTA